eukprot:Phypoly_transcript_14068.p1 GENE.Phypoly_transcript_14068~~Phypoly_transcript_14068.p1  ORF type:complete len:131 (+),score=1.81 Phypoly_transcript_14068:142-534(+)
MKALKGLWLIRSNTKSDLHKDKDVAAMRGRAGSTAGPKQADPIPRLRAIRADTSPDLFGARNRSGSSGSAGGSFASGASYGSPSTGSYFSDETGTDSSDSVCILQSFFVAYLSNIIQIIQTCTLKWLTYS